jgi:hypothetical protein
MKRGGNSGMGGRIILDLKEIGWEFYIHVTAS